MIIMIISTSSCSVCEWLKVVLCLRARTSFRCRRGTAHHHDGDDGDDHDGDDDNQEKEEELGKCLILFSRQRLRYDPGQIPEQS